MAQSYIRSLLRGVKRRARNRKLNFSLVIKDLKKMVIDVCPVLGIKLKYEYGNGKNGCAVENSPSVDRIDPKKSYTKNNCRIISFRANRLKNNASAEELFLVFIDSLKFCKPEMRKSIAAHLEKEDLRKLLVDLLKRPKKKLK